MVEIHIVNYPPSILPPYRIHGNEQTRCSFVFVFASPFSRDQSRGKLGKGIDGFLQKDVFLYSANGRCESSYCEKPREQSRRNTNYQMVRTGTRRRVGKYQNLDLESLDTLLYCIWFGLLSMASSSMKATLMAYSPENRKLYLPFLLSTISSSPR